MGNVGLGNARTLITPDGDSVINETDNAVKVDIVSGADRGISSTITSYDQFDAATSATALNDSTNGINATLTDCLEIIIQCDYDNTGYIMVGSGSGSGTVVAADTNGIRLNAGDMLSLSISHTANVYIDGSASSQKVNVSIRRDS